GDRPLLLPLDLLPGAVGRAVRDRHPGPRFHGGRAAGAAGSEALVDAAVRAPAAGDRADADAAARPSRELGRRPNRRASGVTATETSEQAGLRVGPGSTSSGRESG